MLQAFPSVKNAVQEINSGLFELPTESLKQGAPWHQHATYTFIRIATPTRIQIQYLKMTNILCI